MRRALALPALLAGSVLGACGGEPLDAAVPEVSVTLAPRDDPAVIAVGDATLVWGGVLPWDDGSRPGLGEWADLFLDDGAIVVEGASGTAVPPAPFTASLNRPGAAAVGDDVVLVGSTCAEAADTDGADFSCRPTPELVAAAFDTTRREWRSLTPPPAAGDLGEAWVWVIGASDSEVVIGSDGADAIGWWAVDPATDRWRHLTDGGWETQACVAGSHLVRLTDGRVETLALDDPDAAVERSEPPPVPWSDRPYETHLTCAAGHAVVTTPSPAGTEVLALTLTLDGGLDRWTSSASPTLPYRMSVESTVWTGEQVVVLDANGSGANLGFTPAARTWQLLEPVGARLAEPVWSGDAVVAWDRDRLVRWEPAVLD